MTIIKQKITPMLWYESQAEEAAMFYTSAFQNSRIGRAVRYGKEGVEIHGGKDGALMTIDFELDGNKFVALNGGPHFKINPAISFYVTLESESQVEELWNRMFEGGKVLMALDKYPWSSKYGWIQDRFGVSWQISLGKKSDVGGQTIVPLLMFVKEHYLQAEVATKYYTSVFKNSGIKGTAYYGRENPNEKEGAVVHAQFNLGNQVFMVMDSGMEHNFTFNEAISFVVDCSTQEEIDYYTEKLSDGGDPKAQMCGWLKDRFGVSWQITPAILGEMLQDPDKAKTERVTKYFLGIKKFNIEDLKRAYEGRQAEPAK